MSILSTFQALHEGMPFTIALVILLTCLLQHSDLPIKLRWVDPGVPHRRRNGGLDWRAICLTILDRVCREVGPAVADEVEAKEDEDAGYDADVEDAVEDDPDDSEDQEDYSTCVECKPISASSPDEGDKANSRVNPDLANLTQLKHTYDTYIKTVQTELDEARLKHNFRMAQLGIDPCSLSISLDEDEGEDVTFEVEDIVHNDPDTISKNLTSIMTEKRDDASYAIARMRERERRAGILARLDRRARRSLLGRSIR
ncbi:hypothetical protein CLAFUR0_08704 [Fulvia fulva]|nr:hypothetical protein CLAFUR0_08704 [Fulvia fulva]